MPTIDMFRSPIYHDKTGAVSDDEIAGWMNATPAGKRYAGYMSGSLGTNPVYSAVDAPQTGQTLSLTRSDTAATMPPAMSASPAQSAAAPAMAPQAAQPPAAPPAMSQRDRWFAKDAARKQAKLVQTFAPDLANRLTFMAPEDRAVGEQDIARQVQRQVGAPPRKGLNYDRDMAAWTKRRAEAVSSAVGQAWFNTKQQNKQAESRVRQMQDLAKIETDAARLQLDQNAAAREDIRLGMDMQKADWKPTIANIGEPGKQIPVLMTSPGSAQQVKVEPLPTNLPAIGDKRGELVFTGKVNSQGKPIYEQSRASGPKLTAYELQSKTERQREILQQLDRIKADTKGGNRKPGLDIWPGGETYEQQRVALENELAGIDAVLKGGGTTAPQYSDDDFFSGL